MQRIETHVPITKEYETGKDHFFLTVSEEVYNKYIQQQVTI